MSAQWRWRRREAVDRARPAAADTSLATAVLTLIAGALLTVATGMAVMLELERFGPSLGSIVVFRQVPTTTDRWSVTATIVAAGEAGVPTARGTRRCVLSPGVMAMRGGSLVIEARRLSRPPVYRVHWAGGATDLGPGDCGATADLVLERVELMRLANVAGGFASGLRLIGP